MWWIVILVIVLVIGAALIGGFVGPRNRNDQHHPFGGSFWDWFF